MTGLTSTVVRLKLALLRNGLRQSGGRRAAYVASAVVTLLFAASQLIGLIALRGHEHAASLVVLLVAVLGLRLAAPRTAARLPEILTAVSKG